MTSYEIGRRAEWEVAAQLERAGYDVVRSRGSKGPVDIIACNKTHIRLIQVKYNCEASPAEIEALCYFKGPAGHTEREIWTRARGVRGWTIRSL